MSLDLKKTEQNLNKPKNYLILSIVGSFWLVVLVGALVLWPWWKKSGEIQKQTETINAQAQVIESDNEIVKNKQNILENYKAEIAKLNIAFPKDAMEEELMVQLNNITNKVKGDLKTFTATAQATGAPASTTGNANLFALSLPGFSTVDVPYSGEGQYGDFKNALKEIEKNLRLMTITQATVTTSEEEGGDSSNPKLSFTLSIQSFYGGGQVATTSPATTPSQ